MTPDRPLSRGCEKMGAVSADRISSVESGVSSGAKWTVPDFFTAPPATPVERRARRPKPRGGLLLVVVVAVGAWSGARSGAHADTEIAIGRRVYAQTCANQNCHGDQGAAGRAPALAEREFTRDYVMRITRDGVPDTAMPGWGEQLSVEELETVVSYVVSIQGPSEEAAEELDPDRPWLTHPGRELFFDAARVGACGACHLFDGWGVRVAPSISNSPPENVEELLALEANAVQTARPSGEQPFPALAVASKQGPTQVFDLSAKLPVLRTFPRDRVELTPNASWSHRDVLGIYDVDELGRILDFMSQARAGQVAEEPGN